MYLFDKKERFERYKLVAIYFFKEDKLGNTSFLLSQARDKLPALALKEATVFRIHNLFAILETSILFG